jgi:RND family efflux transporter MFP subunit
VIVAAVAIVLLVTFYAAATFFAPLPRVETIIARAESAGDGAGVRGGTVLTATGYVMPRIKAAVSPRVTGQLEELFVEVGSRVTAGQVLGRLANDDLRARERQLQAEIASRRALLREARANRDELRRDFERQESLVREGAVSRQSYESAKSAIDAAEARVSSAEADLENAIASLEVLRTDIDKTYIRAPFDGTILRKEAEVGEIIGPGFGGNLSGDLTALVTLCDMKSLEVEVDVNESYIARLHEGQPAEIVLDAFPGDTWPGEVRRIVPTANRQKATVQVKIAFREIDDRVMPEMGARVSFLDEGGGQAPGAAQEIWIPVEALRSWEGETSIFAVSEGRVRVVPVRSGPVSGGRVPIFSGLLPGERVIVGGPDDLEPGQRVEIAGEGG